MASFTSNKWVFIALLVAIAMCLGAIAFRQITSTEALLISLVLTIVSMIASWLASRYYAESAFNANLRTFALKAAEKVNNLSNELSRLTGFLQPDDIEVESLPTDRALLERDLRIEAAIHVINTLKSVNDRSLSDWQGIIGDEINAQRQLREAQEEELRELVDRVQSLYALRGEQANSALKADVDSIRRDLRSLASQIGGVPVRLPTSKRKAAIDTLCPHCRAGLHYMQRPKATSQKVVKCKACFTSFVSTYNGSNFELTPRSVVDEIAFCPDCSCDIPVALDNINGASKQAECPKCSNLVRVYRSKGKIVTRLVDGIQNTQLPIDEDLLTKVKLAMPAHCDCNK